VLFVAELARAEQFYTEVFDMIVSARVPQMDAAFLRLARSENDHDLGLFGVGRNAAPVVCAPAVPTATALAAAAAPNPTSIDRRVLVS